MKTFISILWAGIAGGLLTGLPGGARADTIDVRLMFNGKPLQTSAVPQITCRDNSSKSWISCGIAPLAPGQNRFNMPRPAPGNYMIHADIDDNPKNPGGYPGDYTIFQDFTVTPAAPASLRVDVNRLIHLTAPWDNGKPLGGMLTAPIDQKPAFETPRYALRPRIPVTFAWEPLANGAEYEYYIGGNRSDSPGTELLRGKTRDTSIMLTLPPTPAGQVNTFRVFARAEGRVIGEFFTHDAGAQGWSCDFRVVDKTLPLWVYPAVLAVLAAGLWLLVRIPWGARPGLLWPALGCVLIVGAWQLVRHNAARKAAQAAQQIQAQRDAERARQGRSLVADLQAQVPKPAWWDSVEPLALPMDTLGDLMSVWQSGGSMDVARGKRFYRSAYQTVLNHPDDEQLVAEALQLMSHVASDPAAAHALRKFWVDRFFYFKQRTDNCAHCKIGDATGFMVRDLASDYAGNDSGAAIALIDRLIKERDADVSDYNMALTFGVKSEAHWVQRDKVAAIADVREGLRRFPSGWQADQLRVTLKRYETSEPPDPNARSFDSDR